MKKLLYLPLCAAFLMSCGGNEETFDNMADELAHDAEVVAKEGANDIYEYNDALISEQTLLQVEFEKITDLDIESKKIIPQINLPDD